MWEVLGELAKNQGLSGVLLVIIIAGLMWIKSLAVKYIPVIVGWYKRHVLAMEKQNTEMERMNDICDKMLAAAKVCEERKANA